MSSHLSAVWSRTLSWRSELCLDRNILLVRHYGTEEGDTENAGVSYAGSATSGQRGWNPQPEEEKAFSEADARISGSNGEMKTTVETTDAFEVEELAELERNVRIKESTIKRAVGQGTEGLCIDEGDFSVLGGTKHSDLEDTTKGGM